MSNLEQFEVVTNANDGVKMPVIRPDTGEEWVEDSGPVTVTVYGVDSKEFEKITKEHSEKAMKALRTRQMPSANENEIERCVRLTKSWENIGDSTGDLEFNFKNAKKIYTSCPWLRDQILNFAGDRSNYFRGDD